MIFFVYIIYNKKHNKFYIGQTHDLSKRLKEHNSGLSKYTSKHDGDWELKYKEELESRSSAFRREKFLKKQKNKNFYWKTIKDYNSK